MCWSQPARVDHLSKKWKEGRKKNSRKMETARQAQVSSNQAPTAGRRQYGDQWSPLDGRWPRAGRRPAVPRWPRVDTRVVTRTITDGWTDGRTMAAGASVTWTHCSIRFEVTWGKTLLSAQTQVRPRGCTPASARTWSVRTDARIPSLPSPLPPSPPPSPVDAVCCPRGREKKNKNKKINFFS
jgi:hypothetical protein